MLRYYNYDIVFQEIPNEVSLAINITNCPNQCKGCHSPHLQENIGEELNATSISSIMDKYASAITCICFMGGDKTPERIVELARFVRKHYPKLKTAWYSGCTSLPNGFNKSLFQYIKLGSYIEESGPINNKFSNQHLYKIHQDGFMEDISHLFRLHSNPF